MRASAFVKLVLCVCLPLTTALPWVCSSNPAHPNHFRRDIPAIPDRPQGVGPNSFYGSQSQFFDDIGFVAGSPGVEAAPVFLYSRTDSSDVCIFLLHIDIIPKHEDVRLTRFRTRVTLNRPSLLARIHPNRTLAQTVLKALQASIQAQIARIRVTTMALIP